MLHLFYFKITAQQCQTCSKPPSGKHKFCSPNMLLSQFWYEQLPFLWLISINSQFQFSKVNFIMATLPISFMCTLVWAWTRQWDAVEPFVLGEFLGGSMELENGISGYKYQLISLEDHREFYAIISPACAILGLHFDITVFHHDLLYHHKVLFCHHLCILWYQTAFLWLKFLV